MTGELARYIGLAPLKAEGEYLQFDKGSPAPMWVAPPPPVPLDIEAGFYWVRWPDGMPGSGEETIAEYSHNCGYGGHPGWLLTGSEDPLGTSELILVSRERIKR